MDIYALAGSDKAALAAIVAAASKPIEPLPAPVVVPAPIRVEVPPQPQHEAAPAPLPETEAAPQIEARAESIVASEARQTPTIEPSVHDEAALSELGKPLVEEVVTAAPAAKIEPILQPQQAEPHAKADAPKAATKPKAAPPARKKPGNIFAWWWRYRVRGGTYT